MTKFSNGLRNRILAASWLFDAGLRREPLFASTWNGTCTSSAELFTEHRDLAHVFRCGFAAAMGSADYRQHRQRR
jgi:hypothetical protein